jgi:hypothetical protein
MVPGRFAVVRVPIHRENRRIRGFPAPRMLFGPEIGDSLPHEVDRRGDSDHSGPTSNFAGSRTRRRFRSRRIGYPQNPMIVSRSELQKMRIVRRIEIHAVPFSCFMKSGFRLIPSISLFRIVKKILFEIVAWRLL